MKESSLSAEDDKVGTETENEFEERIQPTSLIGTDIWVDFYILSCTNVTMIILITYSMLSHNRIDIKKKTKFCSTQY